ncbi:MAG: hypothetical protein ACRDZ4_09335 [Egibacteraceae bacterium]
MDRDGAHRPTEIRAGVFEAPARQEEDDVVTVIPCHGDEIRIPVGELAVGAGEVTLRCSACDIRWEVRYAPWTGNRRSAIWSR